MSRLMFFRQAMTNWNRFVTACILAGALLAKAGVPLSAILVGLGAAALLNWQMRPRVRARAPRHEPVARRRPIARSHV